jgi:hypothetical protein
MSASLRKFRAKVYAYRDIGTAGAIDSGYYLVTSPNPDDSWWCSRATPSGQEVTVGMRPEHRADAVFGFEAHVDVRVDSAIVLRDQTATEEAYIVRAVLPRDYGRNEVQVLAERVADLILTP